MTVAQCFAFLLLAVLAVGCGQKGPLYLEGRVPHSQRPPAARKQPPVLPESAPGAKQPAPETPEEPVPEEQP